MNIRNKKTPSQKGRRISAVPPKFSAKSQTLKRLNVSKPCSPTNNIIFKSKYSPLKRGKLLNQLKYQKVFKEQTPTGTSAKHYLKNTSSRRRFLSDKTELLTSVITVIILLNF